MSEIYVDFADLTKFIEDFNSIDVAVCADRCNKELAARFLRKVVQRTPVGQYPNRVGGTLRRGWTTTSSGKYIADISSYVNTLSTKKIQDMYSLTVNNRTEYASYVEYGHRTSNHLGWVEGQFMATTSEKEIASVKDAVCEKIVERYLKEKLK